MANDSIFTTLGKNTLLYRTYTLNADLSATQYLAETKFKVGINNATPDISDTDLTTVVPIGDGTVNDDGSNTLTGSNGGDNSTDNTTTYKEGAGVTDVTAQNLITNGTSATKTWTIADIDIAGSDMSGTEPFGLWFYILDATTLAFFKSSGTALSIRFRTNGDGATLYYEYVRTAAQLAVGWNWITSGLVNVADLSTGGGGAPSGALDEFVITVTTNNAADDWTAADVIYDLLRQWAVADATKVFQSGFPTLDYTNNQATTRCSLATTEANGFLIGALGLFNEDSSILMLAEDVFDDESKSSSDEFSFIAIDTIQ